MPRLKVKASRKLAGDILYFQNYFGFGERTDDAKHVRLRRGYIYNKYIMEYHEFTRRILQHVSHEAGGAGGAS